MFESLSSLSQNGKLVSSVAMRFGREMAIAGRCPCDVCDICFVLAVLGLTDGFGMLHCRFSVARCLDRTRFDFFTANLTHVSTLGNGGSGAAYTAKGTGMCGGECGNDEGRREAKRGANKKTCVDARAALVCEGNQERQCGEMRKEEDNEEIQ